MSETWWTTNAHGDAWIDSPDPVGDLERAAAVLADRPAVLVRAEMPGEVWAAWKRLLPCLPADVASIMSDVPVLLNDDLPSFTYRLHMSDGTHTDHKG